MEHTKPNTMSLTFQLEADGNQWHASCKELPGSHTFGVTKQEALKNLKDAVLLYLEDEIENQSMQAVVNYSEKKVSHA